MKKNMAKSETGVQLLARLGKKPSLDKIEPLIFPHGLPPKNVIELYGESNTGKTQLLLHLIVNCILPLEWNNIKLGGLGVGVLFIDTDYHFNMVRLLSMLESRICGILENHREPSTSATNKLILSDEEIEDIVSISLERFHLVKCDSSAQLVITLHSLESLLSNKPEISVMMLDSISAFYWIDKLAGGEVPQIQEQNIKRAVEILSKLVTTYNLVVFAVKAVYFQRTEKVQNTKQTANLDHCEYLSKAWQKIVTHRMYFERDLSKCSKNNFIISWCDNKEIIHRKRFDITSHGISFIS